MRHGVVEELGEVHGLRDAADALDEPREAVVHVRGAGAGAEDGMSRILSVTYSLGDITGWLGCLMALMSPS